MEHLLIEILGYIGSALVVVSMLMSSVVRLRVVNTVGSVVSTVYGLIIGSFPLVLMNVSLIIINIYNLWKLRATENHYDLVPCSYSDGFIQSFASRYKADIQLYFPDFDGLHSSMDAVYLVLCNGDPAGILLGSREGCAVTASVEYTTPSYRDCSVGKFLYTALPGVGVEQLHVPPASEKHRPYLEKMGYAPAENGYLKNLK